MKQAIIATLTIRLFRPFRERGPRNFSYSGVDAGMSNMFLKNSDKFNPIAGTKLNNMKIL
jgi:hypothetical protein